MQIPFRDRKNGGLSTSSVVTAHPWPRRHPRALLSNKRHFCDSEPCRRGANGGEKWRTSPRERHSKYLFPSGKRLMERATRIELAFSAWEADVLPLNYARVVNMVVPEHPIVGGWCDYTSYWPHGVSFPSIWCSPIGRLKRRWPKAGSSSTRSATAAFSRHRSTCT